MKFLKEHLENKSKKETKYLLVVGANYIFDLKELHELSDINVDNERNQLMDE